ncbi:hypothetical protein TREMEDRAFT_67967 [Tremella mesenterica DSM 1558]|uniref:uncharacterized protein n=1 Tax=Tremella mesenterica (strain ATCC 24925 / CBS 8224 / DSM 1558 / NBRC 9311 / NRRL Y-6157 / RJB 2259-6 / UBC 559-6) TaxID=578456 RepID=UPI0003F49C76|nr:uncharacterized protein TREMEDRAFT_67967 [Tremella mesenterica DSM 1558]EIW71809.1 hypothetical protein TREMEDRAFT_67967 [Tremella mesenterica DSM 1558]
MRMFLKRFMSVRKKERTTDLVMIAVREGFRGIDTACQPKHYREDLVGVALRNLFDEGIVNRDDMWIQTKFTPLDGQDISQPLPYDPKASLDEQIRQSLDKSIRNLGVDYLDSVILHSPLPTKEETLLAYRTLEELADQGKVRTLGISNIYDPTLLQWLINQARIKVGVVQNRWYEGNGWDWSIAGFWIIPENLRLTFRWGITPLCGATSLGHIQEAINSTEIHHIKADIPKAIELQQMMRRP